MNSIQNSVLIQYQKNSFALDNRPHSLLEAPNHNTNLVERYLNTMNAQKRDKSLVEIWRDKFNKKNNLQDLNLDLKSSSMTWTNQNNNNQEKPEDETRAPARESPSSAPSTPDKESTTSPSHHARRPMNAFLIFCKKHRPIVRKKYPSLENRGVTRILGEWWAMLDSVDKEAYTNLAKEYKDAFFTANPNFKWYKLPAPPLRPGVSRPISIQKEIGPITSTADTSPQEAEFTPGKLADESQLGLLSSLLNSNNFSNQKSSDSSNNFDMIEMQNDHIENFRLNQLEQNNNINKPEEKHEDVLKMSPENYIQMVSVPPKPIKKRLIDINIDNKQVARNVFDSSKATGNISDNLLDSEEKGPIMKVNVKEKEDNMTNQDLVEKVVERMYANPKIKSGNKIKYKETRTSGRSCKGKKYAEFMRNGKLIKNKRDKRSNEYHSDDSKLNYELNNKLDFSTINNKIEMQTPKLALENTIKRLAERTNVKLDSSTEAQAEESIPARNKTISECSDDLNMQGSMFNLELRIAQLPSLSYDTFLQRKRESKKRKQLKKSGSNAAKVPKVEIATSSNINNNKVLIGSKKRKNKHNITHLQTAENTAYVNNFAGAPPSNDLFGLATLAEIAANTEKLN